MRHAEVFRRPRGTFVLFRTASALRSINKMNVLKNGFGKARAIQKGPRRVSAGLMARAVCRVVLDAGGQFLELGGAHAPAFMKAHLLVGGGIFCGPVAGDGGIARLAFAGVLEGQDGGEERLG